MATTAMPASGNVPKSGADLPFTVGESSRGYHIVYPKGWTAGGSDNYVELKTKVCGNWQGQGIRVGEEDVPYPLMDGLGVAESKTYQYDFSSPVDKEESSNTTDDMYNTLFLPFRANVESTVIDL